MVLVKIVSLLFSSFLKGKVFLQLTSKHKASVNVHFHDVFKILNSVFYHKVINRI